ncbi:probable dolichyl pyrophosphate Man9GlcNAc2 alpha-1,3-glucosyltransferase [Mercurialis annua]|uniref:probable dolichyl pyrophosphate Man9GlcNAc2 alpha-1,3-glucosyltransferase n=1 Tax=Mercurialis annua TaxID=3986 RepID=UPI0021606B12|nr:probable dolichyl pyrophosphate Man9GlcNAc2 alpha-1,3-glucosyltransferase [Mercurialis annua]XP_050228342.1 probable dolichyl pyrophosphate Man9GlcNAc2 alpha-1,3-glucosyltransferase [Mercurialis annua]XP_050228343.1 probable dolichyl pyrophosphate Man9GlcNAc2 alpha-1,3-glucosyltransferase [Mercurialis annua]XP_050228344.1 probable dolichyl pyrophosphate Man9GlcNAc2 alpha-1,3-glucosyltransferase [Mercurialis annua]XP_050228345.1 probable dolichyl pyrophosphate Man9GlcNAc2 alpha-1,3-glucosyltr
MEKKGRKKAMIKNKVGIVSNEDDDDNLLCWLFVHRGIKSIFLCIAVFGLLVRLGVSLHPYSGAANPPKFGDYEAQRHWMEITLNLPVNEWYRNSSANDLTYWGLDYPPLTAYQSYVHGLLLRYFQPQSVSLFTSRGHESYLGKLLMRWTVLSSDALIFFPAVLYFVLVYYGGHSNGRKTDVALHIAIILMNPCLVLIDHGHFQYNCISLGLAVGAVAAVLSKKDLVASVLFCLSLNHKQMSAYYAPAFFSHLLGSCLRRKNPVLEVSKLGFVVFGTFAFIWWPYLHSRDSIFEVLSRLAPFERGIYEDYVANFWCTTSVLIKWKRLFATHLLKIISLAATILTCLPSMIQQILHPSSKGFLYGLVNSSFAFYLFSFQVHEKSILLPLLAASLLAMELHGTFELLMHYALFSMFPLLCRDNLIVPYIALYALFFLLYFAPNKRRVATICSAIPTSVSIMLTVLYLSSLILHIIYLTVHPPEKYPFLFEAMIMLLCFTHFVVFVFYTNIKQWMLSRQFTSKEKDKKLQ